MQCLADLVEPLDARPQVGDAKRGQGRLGAAAPIEKPVHLVHPAPLCFGDYSELAQRAQVGEPTGDEVQLLALGLGQVMLHTLREMAMGRQAQVGDLGLQAHALLGPPPGDRVLTGRPPAFELGLLGSQVLTHLGHGMQHRQGDLLEYMKLTDLMRDLAEGSVNRGRVQIRTVGGDPPDPQPARLEHRLETAEKGGHDRLARRLTAFQDLVEHAFEGVVIDDPHSPCSWGKCGQHAERAVVQLVGSNVAGDAERASAHSR